MTKRVIMTLVGGMVGLTILPLICLLRGHDDLTITDQGVWRLVCQQCGRRTSGWAIGKRKQGDR